jgi:hypothetical protein
MRSFLGKQYGTTISHSALSLEVHLCLPSADTMHTYGAADTVTLRYLVVCQVS